MAILELNPYLNFDGTATQAIALYERVLGAKTEHMTRFGDMPAGAMLDEAGKQRVMHALLKLGEALIMISDTPPGMTLTLGNNIHITLEFDDESEMSVKFQALSEGGEVTMPLQDTFWGARFGMLTDPYGIKWMFNHTRPLE